jgi:uncharacterized protein with von Willebrand factor type A (vWA) domain
MTVINGNAQVSVVNTDPLTRAIARVAELKINPDIATPPAADLLSDTFATLYSGSEVIDNPDPSRAVNKTLLQWVKNNSEWDNMIEVTRGSLPGSIASSEIMHGVLMSDKTLESALKEQEQADKLKQEQEQEQEQADNESDPTLKQNLQNKADKTGELSAAAAARGVAQLEKINPTLKQAIAGQAVKSASDAAEKIDSFCHSWGIDPGSATPAESSEIIKYANDNNKKINDIARVAGRMQGIGSRVSNDRINGSLITRASYTRELSRIFPGEIALLRPDSPPLIRARKIAEFADHGLLGYIDSREKLERGSFICAIDNSGSMRGNNEIIARGLGLGLGRVAIAESRVARLFLFDSRPFADIAVNTDYKKLIEFAGISASGGTSFDLMLDHCIELLRAPDINPAECDLIVISDGECNISPDIYNRISAILTESAVRLWYLCLGYSGKDDPGSLGSLAYKIIEFDDSTAESIAAAIAN